VTKVKDGRVIEVEGKWGEEGRYKHAPDDTPKDPTDLYGKPQYWYTRRKCRITGKEKHTLVVK